MRNYAQNTPATLALAAALFGTGSSVSFADNYGSPGGAPGQTPTPTPTASASPSPSVSPSPSASPSATPSASPTSTPSSTPGQATVTVSILPGSTGKGSTAFGTNPLVISAGTTVTWTNQDSVPHTATSDTGVFDSGTLNTGQSFSRTFSQAGDYPYHCTIHGAASMSGLIRVTGP